MNDTTDTARLFLEIAKRHMPRLKRWKPETATRSIFTMSPSGPSAILSRKPTPQGWRPRSAAKSAAKHDNEGPDSSSFWPSHHDQFFSIIAMK